MRQFPLLPHLIPKNRRCIACHMQKLLVLQLQAGKLAFGFPDPGFLGGEEQIHFFESASFGFWVEGPDDGNGEEVYGAVD